MSTFTQHLYVGAPVGDKYATACGRLVGAESVSETPAGVTCRRCLASRAFYERCRSSWTEGQ